jgi:hypothetical protein
MSEDNPRAAAIPQTVTAVTVRTNGRRSELARISLTHDTDGLHRRVRDIIRGVHGTLFGDLPGLVDQLVRHQVWRGFGFKNFASYALAEVVDNGLGIISDQHLWLLRCSLDVRKHGKHVREWKDLLKAVDKKVRLIAEQEKRDIKSFDGNSLETLAKKRGGLPALSYMPSRAGGASDDAALLRLARRHPAAFEKVAAGQLSIREAVAAVKRPRQPAKQPAAPASALDRIKAAYRALSAADRAAFIDWQSSSDGGN